MTPVLVDIGPLSACCSDHALEGMAKALTGEEGRDDGIFAPHESPFIQQLIERFSDKGLVAIDKVRTELLAFLAGDRYNSADPALRPVPDGFMARWTDRELAMTRLYLESLPPALYTLDDWGLLVDYLVQRYLPLDVLRSEAEALIVKSAMMGRVQANLEALTLNQAAALAAALPGSVSALVAQFSPSQGFAAALEYARVHAVEQVVALSDGMRHRLRQTVVNHMAGRVGAADVASSLQSKIQDDFAVLNRDWRRIAVTEAGEAANNGVISQLQPGAVVRRMEVYASACPFCRKIDGKELTVVSPDAADKNWDTQVWLAKNNVGRSFSPRKRVGSILIHREPEEMWAIPAGLVHPHCRGQWHVVQGRRPSDNPVFAKWLEENL